MAAPSTPRAARRFVTVTSSLIAVGGAAAAAIIALHFFGATLAPKPSTTPVAGTVVGTSAPSASPFSGPTVTVSPEDSSTAALRKAVNVVSCRVTSAGAEASGTVSWGGPGPVGATLTVAFTDAHSRALAVGTATVMLVPGKTASWSIAATFTTTPQTGCVLAGVSRS